MEARKKRNLKDGLGYIELFPDAEGDDITIIRNADVGDTLSFIPKVVKKTLHHTKRIAKRLEGKDTYETCKNIWHFIYDHINYNKDQAGYEQIRSPARTWRDRKRGVDCDCYSVFISSILTNLGIPHVLRITKYWKDYYQHIYPIVRPPNPLNGGNEIVIDCVPDEFNYEVPYSEKNDYPMDLQYLNGYNEMDNPEQEEGRGSTGSSELGKLVLKDLIQKAVNVVPIVVAAKAVANVAETAVDAVKAVASGGNVAEVIQDGGKNLLNLAKGTGSNALSLAKEGLHTFNTINPAMILPRLQWKTAMEINAFNIARRLRWTYLPDAEAEARGMDMDRFPKLRAIRTKLEEIFYAAGGQSDTLREAILGGKGNKDKAVTLSGFEGSELGDPTIAAIIGIVASLAGLITALGPLFKKGDAAGASDFAMGDSEADPIATLPTSQVQQPITIDPSIYSQSPNTSLISSGSQVPAGSQNFLPANNYAIPAVATSTTTATTTKTDETKESFFKKNPWVIPVGIVAGIGVVALLVLKKKKKDDKPSTLRGVSGNSKKRKRQGYQRSIELE